MNQATTKIGSLLQRATENRETRSKKGGGSIGIVYKNSGCWRQLEVDRFIPAPNESLGNLNQKGG